MTTLEVQKKLKKFLDRRHPVYNEMVGHWQFMLNTYEGGRGWFYDNIFKYIKEGPAEYSDRVQRAYRFNHTREVVDLVDKYLFKVEIHRNNEEAPEGLKKFWASATLQGLPIKEYMRSVSTRASIFGRPWLVVDTNKTEAVRTLADEKRADVRVYSYLVEPQNVLDMSYDDLGELNWILIHELVRDDEDPLNSSGALTPRYRLWTRFDSTVFDVQTVGQKTTIVQQEAVPHALGEVPVFPADCVLSDELWTSPSMIADVAYLDKACANYMSNLDAIIQDQTFSQLAMPAQGVSPGEDPYTKLLEMGTKRVFIYDGGEGGNQPFFLSPDVKQAELIMKVVNKIINEIYHSVGLAGERTKEDNAMGIDNSSGVAKAYDFERVNSLLAAKADSLEAVENRLARLVCIYTGETAQLEALKVKAVLYPDNFDVRGLYDEFDIAERLALVEAPETIRREQMTRVLDKLFPQLKRELREGMLSEIKTWPPKVEVLDPAGGAPAQTSAASVKSAGQKALASKTASTKKDGAAI